VKNLARSAQARQTAGDGEAREARAVREHLAALVSAALARHPTSCLVLDAGGEERTTVDWTGLPLRVERRLGRARALGFLDEGPPGDGTSGRDLQEEYVEWRVVRGPGEDGIERVELTTELPERWAAAAAYDPAGLLRRVAAFAREDRVPPSAAFGAYDPFAPGASPEGRARAFRETMLGPGAHSPYNDGRRSICCMSQPTNNLGALVTLAAGALQRSLASGSRAPTAAEMLPLLAGAAQAGRASDPLIVERLGRLAFERRLVALAEPVGVAIRGLQHTRLRTPAGGPVPLGWFTCDGAAEQRVVLEVPPGEGFRVSDLVDVATEEPIRHGGQVAELVQVALTFRVSPAGSADA
jgi:hypothetical protein